MPTITETLTQLGQDLRDAIVAVRGVYADITTIKNSASSQVQTIINNFLGRPAVQVIWLDPINGNDANDGSTAALAKKDIDNLLDGLGITATEIRFLSDATIRRRRGVFPSLTFQGAQPAPNGQYTKFYRNVIFLGVAENSPLPGIGTFCSGLWLQSPNFKTDHIVYNLPAQPAGQDFAGHINADYGTNVNGGLILSVADPSAGSLFSSKGNTMNAAIAVQFGTAGVPGHIFEGVAAGGNPNDKFAYKTGITSA